MLQVFFECLTSNTSTFSDWYGGIKSKMTRTIFQRNMLAGEVMDHSASPLYLTDVRAISAAFARANTQEAAERKLAVKVEAGEVFSKLTEPGLKADALATLLCIAKYNCGARTYRTQWASLYAGELPLHTLLTPSSSLCCARGPQDGL